MPRRHRSVIAIRLAAAIEVESIPLLDPTDVVEQAKAAFLERVRSRADELLGLGPEAFERSLAKVPGDIQKYEFDVSIPGMLSLVDARDRLVRRMKAKCARCKGQPSCGCLDDGSAAPARRTVVGPCISEILGLMEQVEKRVHGIYKQHFEDLPNSKARFATDRVGNAASHGLFGGFHVNGWTEVDLGCDCAVVGLEVADRRFDWPALCQTLYVFAHELVCHAYQGSRNGLRTNADERCSWSEGWMDALAWTITEDWIENDAAEFPEWVRHDANGVKDFCHSLHKGRYEFPQAGSLDRVHMGRRQNAKAAFHRLRKAYAGATDPPRPAKSRVAEFSIQLNLCALDVRTRDRIMTRLTAGLLGLQGSRYERVVGECSAFCEHRDATRLLAALDESVQGAL